MKLNRKGYLTVEVILASVVAVAIALFLMEIIIKLVNITDDAYVDTEIITDKALIIKNIKSLIKEDMNSEECGGISSLTISQNQKKCTIQFCDCQKSITIDGNAIQYGSNNNIEYSKEIDNSIDSLSIYCGGNSYIGYKLFKITGNNKFFENDFEANIIVYNEKSCF